MKKSHAVLFIYDMLLEGEHFHIRDIIRACGDISKRTALRYIKDIKDYLIESDSDLRLKYDKERDSYVIVRLSAINDSSNNNDSVNAF